MLSPLKQFPDKSKEQTTEYTTDYRVHSLQTTQLFSTWKVENTLRDVFLSRSLAAHSPLQRPPWCVPQYSKLLNNVSNPTPCPLPTSFSPRNRFYPPVRRFSTSSPPPPGSKQETVERRKGLQVAKVLVKKLVGSQ